MSQLSIAVSVPKLELEQQLGRLVPKTLAKASRRSVGAAGRVDYHVERDALTLLVSEGELVTSTRLVADIDVCKPLGPVCLHYGRCRPEWQARVTVPSVVSLDEPPRPRLSLGMTRGCVLSPVGYDATPELERITQEQARSARGQIAARVAEAHERMVAGVRAAQRGRPLGDGCVRLEPVTVQQTPIREREGKLEFALLVRARVELECTTGPEPEPYEAVDDPLPLTESVAELDPESRVVLARELPYEELARGFADDGVSLRFASGKRGDDAVLLAGVSGLGRCDPEWVVVDPRIEGERLSLVPQTGEGVQSPAADWLRGRPGLELPAGLGRVGSELASADGWLDGDTAGALSEAGLQFDGPLATRTLATPGPTSLRVGFEVEGTLRVERGDAARQPGEREPGER